MTGKTENIKSLMTLDEILNATGGRLVGSSEDFIFNSVVTDSRNVKEYSLFVPLVGEFQDGHKYVPDAVKAGSSVVFINESEYEKNSKTYDDLASAGTKFIIVKNTLHGLQDAAEGYVKKFPNLIKVAVTGSCGKTTTKEMIVSVLKQKYSCVYTQGNLNSETGLPLSVFNIRKEHECGIFEMGMNRENEIGEIAKVLKPEYAVITNIGTAHIGILGSRENIAKEKRKVFEYISENGCAFIPADDDFKDFAVENVKGNVIEFGVSVPENKSGAKYLSDKGLFGTEFLLDGEQINLPVSGKYNYQNALACVALAKVLGLSTSQIKTGLESFRNIGGRMEILNEIFITGKKVTVVKDCYNANPDAMKKVIELCSEQKCPGNKIFVLGDMKELGRQSESAHKEIIDFVKKADVNYVAFVGTEFGKFKNELVSGNYINCESVYDEKLSRFVLENTSDESILLLKGSNSMSLWDLLPNLIKGGKN
ncbi:MAG: UDP-N-acetylmuramoyl-tripeptide--D-alanyl-D-alanine ligase [Treponema sp.]|nr:UDP-N-acetylmuramoyl-tripeptide--D-alanyl-D-alanine ligase [Treponema sp.]